MIEQLADSDEQADLATIEKRLTKIEQKILSYADQRAEGLVTPEQHRELTMRPNSSSPRPQSEPSDDSLGGAGDTTSAERH